MDGPEVMMAMTPEQRSERAANAAHARWSRDSAVDRSEHGRHAASFRWAGHVPKPKRPAREHRPCKYCGVVVLMRADGVKCSENRCRLAYNAERMKRYVQARRAQQACVPFDMFDPAEVFERDAWICGICSDPIDQVARFPEPLSPSIDHITPLSLGGHHVLINVRAAHLGCNTRRGNRA